MSLRDKIKNFSETGGGTDLYDRYGVISNPFPSSNQTSDNPHYALGEADELAESHIAAFIRDHRSQAVVVEGTQGVGKTNFLNYFEAEITNVSRDLQGYYVVRYLADPETTFDGTIRRLLQELGPDHLRKIAEKIGDNESNESHVDSVRSQDVRTALSKLAHSENDISELMMEWLLGFRLLKAHKETLGVQFRLDTVESKTAALRDIVEVSRSADILSGIFLLLDELEKQDGILGPRAVVRYLSAIRAIIDALPRGLFLMIAVTPDALRRYSLALPALRGRLQNRIELSALKSVEDASAIAHFYIDSARNTAKGSRVVDGGECEILTTQQIEHCYYQLSELARSRGDDGVRQREFLHELYMLAEQAMSSSD